MKDIFDRGVTNELIARIEKVLPESRPLWGKMSSAQMMAHCNVPYEMVFDNRHKKPGPFKTFLLKLFVMNIVVGEKPYKKESPTPPEFLVRDERDFENEKQRLIAHLRKTQQLGRNWFEGRESHSFGALTAQQWNNMFYKHLDHHLSQFGM